MEMQVRKNVMVLPIASSWPKIDLIRRWRNGSDYSLYEAKFLIENLLAGKEQQVCLTPTQICDLSAQGFKFKNEVFQQPGEPTMDHVVRFYTNEVEFMAKFLAAIIKEGLTYKIFKFGDSWEVHLLGRY